MSDKIRHVRSIRLSILFFLLPCTVVSATPPPSAADARNTEILHRLLDQIRTGEADQRRDAIFKLADLLRYQWRSPVPPEVLPLLRDIGLSSHDLNTRRWTYRALAEMKSEAAIPFLIQGLGENDVEIVQKSAEGLGNLGEKARSAGPHLEPLLTKRLGHLPADAFSQILGPDAIAPLLRAAATPHLSIDALDPIHFRPL
jgi:hypothetical protein